jgi:hypothetical protein
MKLRERKKNKSNDWKSMESFIIGLGTVQTFKASTSTRVALTVKKAGGSSAGVCKMKVWSF